ncbi:MAG TPA: helix-turn-helix domain-containing protein [Actinocrinis sp.]|uniref:helix-turn-helix domain-containing protein n=1 Tax=Actinocrinis sp. TaxID=1920516 RepID=UPI002D496561|nr:helix-turn-helix domain-containing protein [Actinocrinis sp.]HZU55410.1 helix-turn-helix domain-containing protein [Actinocrinis sp.]
MRTTVPAARPSASGRLSEPEGERETLRFDALLQHYRRRAGMTQTQLADFSTVSVRAIRDLEAGRARRPRRDTVRLLADALRLSDERRSTLEAAAGRGTAGIADEPGTSAAAARAEAAATALAPPLGAAGPLFGREEETRTLYELLAAGQDRLVAIVGLSGVGKSRLMLAVAQSLHTRLRMPVLWLSTERQEAGIAHAIRRVQVTQPWVRELLENPDDAVDDLAAFIGDRPFLLVLDGQRPRTRPGLAPWRPAGAGPRATAAREALLSADAQLTLLARCPKLRIVSTLRTADVSASSLLGQRTLRLSPLPVYETLAAFGGGEGEADDVLGAAAQLVNWHMQQSRPHRQATRRESEAIRSLTRSLDGIPLALESAAAWSLVLAPARLAAIAARDPFAVTAPPADRARTRSDPIRAGLVDAIAALTPQARRVLSLVSRWTAPWTLDQVVTRSGHSLGDVSRAVHALLVHDLIRPAPAESDDAPEAFTVLHLVRHLVRRPAQRPADAYPRPIGLTAPPAAAPASALTRP